MFLQTLRFPLHQLLVIEVLQHEGVQVGDAEAILQRPRHFREVRLARSHKQLPLLEPGHPHITLFETRV